MLLRNKTQMQGIHEEKFSKPAFVKTTYYLLRGLDDLKARFPTNFQKALDLYSPDILAAGIGLEETCNYKCIYCYAGHAERKETEPQRNSNRAELLAMRDYASIIDQASALGAKTLIICGNGEPFLSPKILGIIDTCYGKDMSTIIFTNGSVFGDNALCKRTHDMSSADLLKKISKKNVSIMVKCESISSDTYKTITKHNFETFVDAVENIREYFCVTQYDGKNHTTNVGISTVVMKDNFNEIPQIARFANERGFQFVCKFPSLMGSAINHTDYFFSPQDATEKFEKTLAYVDKRETMLIDQKYCVINQLGLSIDNTGYPLFCLSSRRIEESEPRINIRNTPLEKIATLRKEKSPPVEGDCPKKSQWYSFKRIGGDRLL